MSIQVLVSTMNQKDFSLLDKMNIQTDAIIINQCDRNEVKEFNYKGNKILWMSFNERGVGLSRNNALMRATADICLMADDDMVYVDGYKGIVQKGFMKNPKANMLLFNVPIHLKTGQVKTKINKNKRIRFFNSLKFGTVNIAFRREEILKKNIFFSLLFGGGAKYSSGEDSLFIMETLKKRLKIYSIPKTIANIQEGKSSWFEGYTKKYFFDKGVLYYCLMGRFSKLIALQFVLRHKLMFQNEMNWLDAYRLMLQGIKKIKFTSQNNKKYDLQE